ncbi:glutathione S-transferase [Pseudomonas sp. 148P]|uniref:Glutathione S-transferase n=1 Tax=Pseudomonas ulcerans TaxID=3115852 RepID=A0ABU7HS12_9PSED|nr:MULTISPECIES: glutathione S-transferase [unclassified Pseudomonas]MEE1922033.1 glutathione S-transferase [Pseudomonas sp. 147P]MEE1934307.1 glutathione S-transferase [Pseudomonas sp. 148P]
MKIHYHPLSGHAHRVVLFASLLGVPHELVKVDLAAGAHKSPAFLALNPFGQIPVLEDGEIVLADSNAILVYLAKKAGRSDWLPEDALGAARVQRWLSVAAGELAYGPAAARLVTVFNASFNADEVIARAHVLLGRLEQHLADREWLAADHPTIADVAIYSYIAQAPEGNVYISGYPAVNALLRRIEALPGFVPFTQSRAGLRA